LINELHSKVLGIREISRQVGVSCSTASRVLQKDPNRKNLAEQEERLRLLEAKLRAGEEVFREICNIFAQYDVRHKNRLLEVLWRWPTSYFKLEHQANRL
jgi:IS30 family transposase